MPATRPTDPVGGLVGDPVATIRPTQTLRDAATALTADTVGLLVLVDPSGVRGVISERDIVAAIAEGLDLDVERVRDVATTDLLSVDETMPVAEAGRTMLEAQIRHLAVERTGVVTGVISMRDVLRVLIGEAASA